MTDFFKKLISPNVKHKTDASHDTEAATETSISTDTKKAAQEPGRRKRAQAVREPTPGKIKSIANQERVLRALVRFGFADTPLIGLAAFRDYKQAQTMADRTCRAMVKTGLLLRRKSVINTNIFVLTTKGANQASELVGYEVSEGSRLLTPLSPAFLHRSLGYQFVTAVEQNKEDDESSLEVFTEMQIPKLKQAKRFEYERVLRQRKPDALLCYTESKSATATWVEVERGYKTRKRFNKQLDHVHGLLEKRISHIEAPLITLKGLEYVYDPAIVSGYNLVATIIETLGTDRARLFCDNITIYRANIIAPYRVTSFNWTSLRRFAFSAFTEADFELQMSRQTLPVHWKPPTDSEID